MRVLDTATILAAMAQVSPRKPRGDRGAQRGAADSSAPTRVRSCHRPPQTPAAREADGGDRGEGPRVPPRLVVVPQGVIPVIVMSTRLATASRAPLRAAS